MIRKLFAVGFLCAVMSPVSPAFGWAGGPWSNDSPDGTGAQGTYQAAMSGKNLLGVAFFSYGGNYLPIGYFSVFHEGIVNVGSAEVIIDLPSRSVNGVLLGSLQLPDENGDTGDNGVETDATRFTVPYRNDSIDVRARAEGAFDARITSQAPVVVFSGDGLLTTPANQVVEITGEEGLVPFFEEKPVSPDTTLDDWKTQYFGEFANTAPVTDDGTTYNAHLRTMTPFEIRGSRTSTVGLVFPPNGPQSTSFDAAAAGSLF